MKLSNVLKYIAVILIVTNSGGNQIIGLYVPGALNMLFFLAIAIIFHISSRKKVSSPPWFLLIGILIWIVINQKIIHTDSKDNYYFLYLFNYVSTFLIITGFTFEDFRSRLLKVLTILSLLSIIVHEMYWFHMIGGVYHPDILSHGVTTGLYLFNVAWGENRFASIFGEPGQYQIILNFTFVLCFNDIVSLIRERNWAVLIKRYGILVLALLLTISTTGYLSFGLFCIVVAFKTIDRKNIALSVFILCLMSAFAYQLYQSDTVQNKFDEDQDVNASYTGRMADNLGLLTMIQDRPFVGYGIGTRSFAKRAITVDNQTSSNGWLNAGAQLGVPFLIVLLVGVFMGVRRIERGKVAIMLFAVVLMSQANEAAYALPFLTMFLFPFNKPRTQRGLEQQSEKYKPSIV